MTLDGEMWEIMADVETASLTVYRSNGFAADSEGPTLHSREEFERFVSNLRHTAARVWPESALSAQAIEDRELRPLLAMTRPTYDQPGVFIQLVRDDGQPPIEPGESIRGRLTLEQAEGLARDLALMVRLARESSE